MLWLLLQLSLAVRLVLLLGRRKSRIVDERAEEVGVFAIFHDSAQELLVIGVDDLGRRLSTLALVILAAADLGDLLQLGPDIGIEAFSCLLVARLIKFWRE